MKTVKQRLLVRAICILFALLAKIRNDTLFRRA